MPERHVHAMPFGAALLPEGGVRFRLWAPSAASVAVELEGGEPLPLQKAEGGWFELTTYEARAGTRYRFVLPDGLKVPDPASRFQPEDVHAASQVVDPSAYEWRHTEWKGRPWHETVLYELHVGTFTPEGTYRGVLGKLDHLVNLGVTAIELMPLADFAGTRNWGYDGVLPFAPDGAYGTPDELKELIDAAHGRGLMVFLDVVYNHFGPEGNYLHAYAAPFFTDRHHTPWGAAIDFHGPVREFFIHNALYWLEEFRFDGLRFDAVHAIIDESDPDILSELAERVQDRLGRDRHIHLVLENDDNAARYLERDDTTPRHYAAQWNDDWHHVAHVLATGEAGGYYEDYAGDAVGSMARALAEGFVYQGDPSPYRDGEMRGESSAHLSPLAFVNFLQNHDQIGNRAFGDRLAALVPEPRRLRALMTATLLAPGVPMLFMGEEWGETRPFQFFCDFGGDLAQAVRDGRRREFAKFPEFADERVRERIPDPTAFGTFEGSRLDWEAPTRDPHAGWLAFTRTLLRVRAEALAPRLNGVGAGRVSWRERAAFAVSWPLADGASLRLLANFGDGGLDGVPAPRGWLLGASEPDLADRLAGGVLPGWSVLVLVEELDS